MPKLNVGLTKKIGQPDYGSLGASCNIELELDASLLHSDLNGFHERVERAFAACRQAVNDELARQQGGDGAPRTATAARSAVSNRTATNGNGAAAPGTANVAHRASAKQMQYAKQLAGRIRGMGIRRLDQLAEKMFNKPVAELSSFDASNLIDTLKQIVAGEIDLDSALNGAAA
jgi:hypothetical protein